MEFWQQGIIILYGLLAFYFFFKAYFEISRKKNAFGQTDHLFFLGSFVWGDMIVLGPFWVLSCLTTFLLHDWYLFLLILSLFWVVRSLGETIYWLNEQFAGENRNPAHQLRLYKFFQNDAVWFVYQLFWQCFLVISLICSLFFATLWLQNL